MATFTLSFAAWLALPVLTWLFYLAVMALYKVRNDAGLSLASKALGYPLLWIGLVLDALTNVLFCTVIFLELPREPLVTSRVSRLKAEGGWRGRLAGWICSELLDPYDPTGCHCK